MKYDNELKELRERQMKRNIEVDLLRKMKSWTQKKINAVKGNWDKEWVLNDLLSYFSTLEQERHDNTSLIELYENSQKNNPNT